MTPANTFLYAGTTNGIYGYTINSNGSISVLNSGNSLAQDVVATAMQVDSTGELFAGGGHFSHDADPGHRHLLDQQLNRILTAVTGSPLALYTGNASTATLVTPTGMLITPNNSYVYVSLGSLGVQVLTLGSGGALSTGTAATILAPISTSTSPSDAGLASDPNSLFLFVAEINTGLRVLSIGTGGTLKEVSGSPYAVGTGPTGVILDATGSYVYVANKGSNNISAFTLTAASGKLTAVAGSPFSSGGQVPIGMVNDNSKKYVAVINSGNNGSTGNSDVQLFKFDATIDGKLDPVATASTGTDPTNPKLSLPRIESYRIAARTRFPSQHECIQRKLHASVLLTHQRKHFRPWYNPCAISLSHERVVSIRTLSFGFFSGLDGLMLTGRLHLSYVCCFVAPPPNWPALAPLLRNLRRSDDRAEWLHPFARASQAGDGLRGGQANLSERSGCRCIESGRFGQQWRAARGHRARTPLPQSQDQQGRGGLDRRSYGHRPGDL